MRILFTGLLCLTACASPAEHPSWKLLTGGTLVTLDPTQPDTAEAMVIGDGIILAVGKTTQLRSDYPTAEVVDLGGRTVLPGFIDSHAHVHEFGHDRRKADLTGAESVAAMVERLRDHAPNPAPGEWIIGAGWDEGVWGSLGYPDRALLDEAFPDNPVALESLHGFAGFYNGAALAVAGVDAETGDPEGGTILRRDDGSPTGVMLTLAQGLVQRHVPGESLEDTMDAIVTGLELLGRAGVTSVHEAGVSPERLAAFQRLADQGRLPIRVYAMLDGNDEGLVGTWFERGPEDHPGGFLSVRGIKVFYDGSLGSRTALLRAPYSDDPHAARPTERITPEAVASLAARAAAGGFQMAVHAIGDEGNDRTLGLFEEALAAHPGLDHRWRIEHAQVVLPDFFRRAAALGVLASMQPSHAVGDSKWAEERLGPDRIRHAYAWRSFRDAGVEVLFNSDLPGEPWTPMETLYFAVTRQTLDETPWGGWYPEQAFTVDEALRAMTLAGAYGAFQEARLGSLTPGKAADFIELDQDPRAVEPGALKDITVSRTWVAGSPLDQEAAGSKTAK